jgi:hypothetical protein
MDCSGQSPSSFLLEEQAAVPSARAETRVSWMALDFFTVGSVRRRAAARVRTRDFPAAGEYAPESVAVSALGPTRRERSARQER